MPVSIFHNGPSFRVHLRALTAGLVFLSILMQCAFAQTELATILGRVTDSSGAVVAGAEVEIRNIDTNLAVMSGTNGDGLYTIPSLHPGHYVISVRKPGFKTVSVTQLDVNVQDNVVRNFVLQVGSSSESITVTDEGEGINTTDATVSTVVDRNFAENLPMNGRSFQTLIQLTPGVVLTPSNTFDSGQFSVNGQRTTSNYWMLDGVSANIGIGVNNIGTTGNALAGTLGSFSAQGGTNSLVSVDALQEFRIQTSTYAPEFGRTPGGQISIATRAGTNQFHGTAFDYLRNDVFDASNWFNGYTNNPPLPKSEERQNDFGGTLSGPIWRNRTFFFFSYEGLRLRLPQTVLTTVPDLNARQNALPPLQPYLKAFPMPNGLDDPATGTAHFNASFSNRSSLDAYSLRIDHKVSDKLTVFGRYNYSPSDIVQRGNQNAALSSVSPTTITVQTLTGGTTWLISSKVANDLRFNYSRTNAFSNSYLDNFGGADPLVSLPFPSPYTSQNSYFAFDVFSLTNNLADGFNGRYIQRQINVVDSLSVQQGLHNMKFGVDFRRLSPLRDVRRYEQGAFFPDVSSAENGNLAFSFLVGSGTGTLLFRNLGMFAQDTWRLLPRLTLTYGVRWDVDFAPATPSGLAIPGMSGFNLNNPSNLALAPVGTPPFKTTYNNLAPRVGAAYQFSDKPDFGAVLRGGFGIFYDLATSEVGNINVSIYPFGGSAFNPGGTFPLNSSTAAPPAITPAGGLAALDPNLKLPYTLEWNVAFEQALGRQQTVSASYIGSIGRRLIETAFINSPNQNFPGGANLVSNGAISSYNALQVEFERRLSRGLRALASYTWAHSIDDASGGSAFGNSANASSGGLDATANRGPSDFDIRNAFSAGVTYDVQVANSTKIKGAILDGWSVENVIQVRSASPVTVFTSEFFQLTNTYLTAIRPDEVPGQPLYLYGPQYPGGKGFNPAAFANPPVDPNTGSPLRQGNVGRNALRAFGAAQWDFAVHRDFQLHESLKLQFRAEMFNVLNHPNFGPPSADLFNPQFGHSTQLLAQSLNGGNLGGGAFNPLYQIGGPRSIQFALKLFF
jgi:carboxypeptidase family protein/TonB-dependent receptor-like protein